MSNAAQNLEPVVAPAAPVNTDPSVAAPAAAAVVDPAAPAAPASIPTALTDPAAPPAAPGDWPENWRELYAGTDEKLQKEMARYASPKAALDALIASKQKIRSGELTKKPGKDALPEEIAAWREAQGVPEKPEGYLEQLPQGLVIGEEDKEFIGAFAADMHGIDAPPALVHKAIEFYYKTIDAQRQAEFDANMDAQQETLNVLQGEYGQHWLRNKNMIDGMLKSLPNGAGEAIGNAVGPDGVAILNKPDVVRAFVQWAHQMNPVATLIPGATNPKALGDRLAEIREMQKKQDPAYWSDAIQKEELSLIEMQQKLAG
jgi:hypothetical protein